MSRAHQHFRSLNGCRQVSRFISFHKVSRLCNAAFSLPSGKSFVLVTLETCLSGVVHLRRQHCSSVTEQEDPTCQEGYAGCLAY